MQSIRSRLLSFAPLALIALATRGLAQGPGSCGVHLDVFADLTSTHASIADMPGSVGGLPGPGIPVGAPGNPYTAWASPGSTMRISLSVPAGTLGGLPFGPGSLATIFWALGTPNIPFPLAAIAPSIPDCAGTGFAISSVLPGPLGVYIGGIVPIPFADPGYPSKLEVTTFYPPGAPAPFMLQGLIVTPGGVAAVSNGVAILPGPNPGEATVIPGLVASSASPPTDEGQALGVPTPPGFTFYGVPVPACDIDTNGFIDFCPGAAACGGADFTGDSTDLGCAPAGTDARPRIDVNHSDLDFTLAPGDDLTVELAPPGPGWPARLIVRWKNATTFGSAAPFPVRTSAVCELWDDGRIVVVRQRTTSVAVTGNDQTGISPGILGQGFGGPPPAIPTCGVAGGIDLSTLWGGPGFVGAPFGVIHMDSLPGSLATTNLAIVFSPAAAGPFYTATVF